MAALRRIAEEGALSELAVQQIDADTAPSDKQLTERARAIYNNNPNYIKNFRFGTGSAPGVLNPGSYFAFDPVTGKKCSKLRPVVTTWRWKPPARAACGRPG